MFVDAKKLSKNFTIDVDVCIVGAGAAGITLARDLAGRNRTVALIESGGFDFDADTQALYAGAVVGHDFTPLNRDRLRYLGGTTNHWGGSCRPFDALDLEDWPFGLDVLEPYYRPAHEICQLGSYSYDPMDWSSADARPMPAGAGANLKSGLFHYSPPTRFGTVYRDDLSSAEGLSVYLNANLLDIETSDSADRVTGLRLACLDGKQFHARARHFVLSAGGVENARLLLNANRVQKAGLGNQFDQLGRYFMDHPYVIGGATVLADASSPEMRFFTMRPMRGSIVAGYLSATDEVRRREHLPPFAISVFTLGGTGAEPAPVVLPQAMRRNLSEERANQIEYYLSRLVAELEKPADWLFNKVWREPPGTYTTLYICGPAPDPQSRVMLGDGVDALGMRKIKLDWRLPDNFGQQMQRAHELLGQDLGRAGLGRLRIESSATGQDPMQNMNHGHHHMGTTRMHNDPRHGVVDADCRVHGISNLFIAGSSVFTTYACDDPTMTIVALALRLSNHLKSLAT
ncbi:MAG TPA: GMC family oxidoreductase [Steroidobacteraceae bacterium]|nr:GMC family oxidoreductase [Steroidobacteraceae bacterium]